MKKASILSSISLAVLLTACGAESVKVDSVPAQVTTEEPKTFDNASLEGLTASKYVIDKTHAYLAASVDHSGGLSDYYITFTDYDAEIYLDPADLEKSTVAVTIAPSEIFVNYPADYKASHANTGFDSWAEDISNSESWLNATKFPEITFKSTSVERTGDMTGEVTGDLTFLGVTKPVTLDVTFRGNADNQWAEGKIIGFDAETTFKRSEFGLGTYIPMIGDEIELTFSAEFKSVAE